MPELPEIETLVRDMQPLLVGRSIIGVQCRQPKALNLPLEEFNRRCRGAIGRVWRRAKSAIIDLPEGHLWMHLGLGGRVLYGPDEVADATFAFLLNNGARLSVRRTFMGRAHFVSPDEMSQRLAALGPEPLEVGHTEFGALVFRGRSLSLKALLMDQSRISGIGNVYSDEILHRMQVHPARKASSLEAEQTGKLLETMRAVLEEALAARGEPGFVGLNGQGGSYILRIHGQTACRVCGTPAEKLSLAGRTAYRCPTCQPE